MKNRLLLVITAFAALISFVSCQLENSEKENKSHNIYGDDTASFETEDANTENNIVINDTFTILQRHDSNGGLEGIELISAPDIAFVDESIINTNQYPIYVDEFAYNQLGPMFEITDEILGIMRSNLKELLFILYEESIPDEDIYMFDFADDLVVYNRDNIEFISRIDGISARIPKNEIPSEISVDTAKTNSILAAAFEYLNIQNPQMKITVEYDTNDNPNRYTYKFYEDSSNIGDYIINNTFNYVELTFGVDSSNAVISLNKIEHPDVYSSPELISYSNAVNYIAENFDDVDTSKIKAEVYYDSGIVYGYYIPCYRFYVVEKSDENSNSSNDEYTYTIDISMISEEAFEK